ncbi:c-type cytochrome [Marinobacter pelagius]|uniref:Cytochrome c55X n=1 Tax=Marinobacter pelagius TaxID=379482 RepID=A0A1I4VGR4_9GAMM|nr:cytochrome c [Marinobacter pelagius]SFN00330.1 cytochrome c55X [Marinobacter pelagius]
MGWPGGWKRKLSVFAVCSLLLTPVTGAEPRTPAELASLVVQDCGSCHGMTLKGGLGPPLRPDNLEQLPAEAIAAIIREGVPDTAMPPWKPLLAPEEIDWISRQLKAGALVSPQ